MANRRVCGSRRATRERGKRSGGSRDAAAPALPRTMDEARSAVRAADSLFADLGYRMGTGYAFAATVASDGVMFGNPQP